MLLLPPEDDIARRLPVWQVMQMLFMDTDPTAYYEECVTVCAQSSYDMGQLEAILFNEILPALRFNLLIIAGEWRGYEIQSLVDRILTTHRFGKPYPWIGRRYTRTHWLALKPKIEKLKAKFEA